MEGGGRGLGEALYDSVHLKGLLWGRWSQMPCLVL
jgi:hypothetical protein